MRIRSNSLRSHKLYNRWFYIPQPLDSPAMRIFFFPYAGVGGEVYHAWSSSLPEDVEFYSLQYPGRGKRIEESPVTDANELIAMIGAEIKPLMDKPTAFLGHCMGGLILFELAQQLFHNGDPLPVQLFLSGVRSPHTPMLYPDLHNLPDDAFIAAMKRLNLRPDDVFAEETLLNSVIQILKKDFQLVETWSRQPETLAVLPIPMCVFGGGDDPYVQKEQIDSWQVYTDQEFNSHIFPGGHFFLHDQMNMQTITAILKERLKSWLN